MKVLLSACVIASAAAVPTSLDRHGRVVNGDTVLSADDWPWFVSLQSTFGSHFCGGSLVGLDVVMTAAHCVVGSSPSSIRAVVGEHNLDVTGDGIVRAVSQISIHPNYNGNTFENDIALLKLSTCMPAGTPTIRWDDRDETALFNDIAVDGAYAAIIGLGTLSSGGSTPRILQEARVFVLTHTQCVQEFNDAGRNGAALIDAASMICGDTTQPGLGYGDNVNNVDTCQGDSGGPFATRDSRYPNEWVLTGLVSWGYGCAGATPGVYTRVATYDINGWLDSTYNSLTSTCVTAAPIPSTAAPTPSPTVDPCNYNGVCEAGENCGNCPNDCISGDNGGTAAPGNGVCEPAAGETCRTTSDCNGRTGGKRRLRYCCGLDTPCSDSRCGGSAACDPNNVAPDSFCCGDGTCSTGSESSSTCGIDCPLAPPPPPSTPPPPPPPPPSGCQGYRQSCSSNSDCCSRNCKTNGRWANTCA